MRRSPDAHHAPIEEPPASSRISLLEAPPASVAMRPGDAPLDGEVVLPLHLTLDEAARRYIEAMVRACDGNKTEAAKRLNVGRNTLARALKGKGNE